VRTDPVAAVPLRVCSFSSSWRFCFFQPPRSAVRRPAVAGTGTAGFTGDGGDPLSASLSDPRDVAATDDGRSLYIADRGNNRIRIVSLASPLINTFAGSGDTEFAGNLIDAGVAGLWSPIGVATSPFGLVMISDTEHHIVWRTPTGF